VLKRYRNGPGERTELPVLSGALSEGGPASSHPEPAIAGLDDSQHHGALGQAAPYQQRVSRARVKGFCVVVQCWACGIGCG
jgi:hypothetical protein